MPTTEIAERFNVPVYAIYNRAGYLGLKRPPQLFVECGKRLAQNPRSHEHRYKKGNVSHNKGKKMPPEQYERCKATMFKKGDLPKQTREVGSERVNRDGYTEIKVAHPNKWKLKHRVIWEEAYGEIPEGCNIQFKNHNPQDLRLENLYLISKADQISKENSYLAKYPKVMQQIIQLKGAIKRQTNKYERNNE